MRSLWPAWPRLRDRFRRARTKLLFLDFDGTLAPIARVPRAVILDERVCRLLSQLARRQDYRLCLISGRAIADLRNFIWDKRWIYVGNHGFEIEGWGLSVPERALEARKSAPLITMVSERLRIALEQVAGVLIENKGVTLSVHFRNVPRGLVPLVREAVRAERRRPGNRRLAWRLGKKVWEARPKMDWSKGHAALYVRRHFPGTAIAVLGDDRTDEDMFRMLKGRGLTIRVGRARSSSAEYYLTSQKEVSEFLQELCR